MLFYFYDEMRDEQAEDDEPEDGEADELPTVDDGQSSMRPTS